MTAQTDFTLIVGYGTDMGNSEDAAMSLTEAFEEATGVACTATELNQVDLADLQTATHFVAVVSTFGDGEFTDDSMLFWEGDQRRDGRAARASALRGIGVGGQQL